MKVRVSQSEFCLAKGQTLSLADALGVRVQALAGTLWITQDHDRRDIVLDPGESFDLDVDGQVVVQALAPSQVALQQPAPAARSEHAVDVAVHLRGALRRLLPRPAWT